MKRATDYRHIVVGAAIALALMPGAAFGLTGSYYPASYDYAAASAQEEVGEGEGADAEPSSPLGEISGQLVEQVEYSAANKLLSYDPADIEAIGTQESTGHTICCPSFSCAYADAVMDGTVHDHDYYTCSCCTWTDWGGGNSSDRYVGSDEELLREAYDQISMGRPTVIHVAAGYGEHWIALIGYENATDPDHLTLSNFIALDPWDGAQVNAGDSFSLYGDGCEHISSR